MLPPEFEVLSFGFVVTLSDEDVLSLGFVVLLPDEDGLSSGFVPSFDNEGARVDKLPSELSLEPVLTLQATKPKHITAIKRREIIFFMFFTSY